MKEVQLAANPKDLLVEMRDQTKSQTITPQMMAFYAKQYDKSKVQVDQNAAEMQLLQDKIRLLSDLITDVNNLTDKTTHGLDLTNHPEVQEKIRVAKELGVKIKDDLLNLDADDRHLLLDHLNLKADEWNFDINTKTQTLNALQKHLERILILMNEVRKGQDRQVKAATSGIK